MRHTGCEGLSVGCFQDHAMCRPRQFQGFLLTSDELEGLGNALLGVRHLDGFVSGRSRVEIVVFLKVNGLWLLWSELEWVASIAARYKSSGRRLKSMDHHSEWKSEWADSGPRRLNFQAADPKTASKLG